jgi:hypothetical protein
MSKIKFSVVQVVGMILAVVGIAMMGLSVSGIHQKMNRPVSEGMQKYEAELNAGVETDIVELQVETDYSKEAVGNVPLMLCGGVIVLMSTMLFFTPMMTETVTKFRQSRKEDAERMQQLDEPTDCYDYILDEDMRKNLRKEENMRVYKEYEKKLNS